MGNGVKAWSYSAYALYAQCPLKYAEEKLRKNKGPQSPAMARGDQIHKAAARFIEATGANALEQMPQTLLRFGPQILELRALPAADRVVEQQWGFDSKWRPTGWFGPTTWFRSILDVGVVYEDGTGDVVDHKSGKIYPENADQRELNALAFFKRFPHVENVTSRMWYLDSGDERLEEFFAEDVPALTAKWEARVAPMFTDEVFAPRPNDKCQWCHLAKSKGGLCRFG